MLNKYSYDITTYLDDDGKKLRIKEIYKSIPSELNSKNKRFISSNVIDKNYLNNNNIEDEFVWLSNAGIIIPVFNVSEPISPLSLSSNRKTLKAFMNDIGFLDAALYDTDLRNKLLKNEKEINFGAPYENAAAQELYAHGFNEKLFYYNSKKHGEVDFLLEVNREILPIEIKSGKPNNMNYYNHVALTNLIKTYNIKESYLFGECNVKKENEYIYQFPIYMISFLSKS
ncbi:MAG TPA: hypothetical protein DEF61_00910 [Firmicutes bacterium]|nr:hypothetical protein [Bacillota bacterium]